MAFERDFVCKYCHRVFQRERAYLEHKCKQMKHQEELQTPNGQAAWQYYQMWFRTMKKMPPRADAFLTSKYFRTFMNIASFFKRVNLPKPEKFIWLMVEKNFPPTMWMLDDAYALYIEFLEYKTAPLEQVQISIDTLFRLAEEEEVDVADIFNKMHPNDLIQLIRSRRVSPWLLLLSKKFRQYYIDRVTPEQRIILETLIRPDSWASRFEKHKDTVINIKQCIQELNL
jgi:hypothetical protein